jgi:hypothetical protein
VLYGVDRDDETEQLATDRQHWKKAHILPLKVPLGTPELATLEQDRDEVLKAVRGGFAVAFDLLAPAIGLEIDQSLTGEDVAKVIFPEGSAQDDIMEKQISLQGDEIQVPTSGTTDDKPRRSLARRVAVRLLQGLRRKKRASEITLPLTVVTEESGDLVGQLLHVLPGLQDGKMKHFTQSLEASRLDQ